MARLIQKCGYIRPGSGGAYMKYIATREGVEILRSDAPPTEKQQMLIRDVLYDFPDSEELFEYADFLAQPTVGNASAFLSAALDQNAHTIQNGDVYMKYIATRPRAEKQGEHGLFGSGLHVDLDAALRDLESHKGNTWTIIFSLHREDAVRMGFDHAEAWRMLLTAHQTEIAQAMKISPEHLRWYAAFHDEGHHPHIHMMLWSNDPGQGYLSKDGVKAIRSALTNAIFQDEMYQLYKQKDISYKELTRQAGETMRELIRKMQTQVYDSPVIEQKMRELIDALETAKGKKQYGYLPKAVKVIVDSIVDELAKQPEVAACYEVWNKLRDELEGYYKDKPRERLPLSQQKEFRSIKNAVIREAENVRLGVFSFEDEQAEDEQETPPTPEPFPEEQENDNPKIDYRILYWENQWRCGNPWAAHALGKLYRDGVEVPQDLQEAERWFRLSAESGNEVSEYTLGKLLLSHNPQAAVHWLERSASHGYECAMYRLGKLCLVEKDVQTAMDYFTAAGKQGNQYAQYALGKLYLQGREIAGNKEEALRWLEAAAAQGNVYAHYLLTRAESSDPSLVISATRLLRHLAGVFRERAIPANPQGIRIDSQRRRQLMRKRLALGHKMDDHEEQTQLFQ